MHRNRGRTGVPSFAMILLLNELMRSATNQGIPPITLASIATQILIFLRIIRFPWNNVWDICLSVDSITNRGEYLRLVLSQLSHGDDWHLYYNMVSFLWKGRSLEPRLGTIRFLFTLIVFTLSTAFAYLLLNQIMAQITHDNSYLYHCSVGFSGVIFALKVLTTHYDRSSVSYFMGIPIGSKYAVWAELVLIQLISPNASFVGHLAGILVGLAYIHGPLHYVIQLLTGIFDSFFANNIDTNESHYNTSGYNASHSSNNRQYEYRNERYFERYVPSGMTEEEQIRRASEESLLNSRTDYSNRPSAPPYPTERSTQHQNSPSYPTNNYDAESIRRLRLRHYQR